jgi:hypothetical protein
MAKTFGAMVYFLPWEKVEMYMTCMDLEAKISKIEADKPKQPKPSRHGR